MKPRVQIRKISEHYFNYAVSNGDGDDLYAHDGLRSMRECLHDAATALGLEFRTTTISYDGVVLGDYPVLAMEHDTVLLATRLRAQLDAAEESGLDAAAPPASLNEVDEPYPRHWLHS